MADIVELGEVGGVAQLVRAGEVAYHEPKLERAQEAGVIRGYTALVVAAEKGGTVAVIQITLERRTEDHLDRFEAAALRHPEIRQCLLMTGGSDYLLRVEAADAAAQEAIHREILSRLRGGRPGQGATKLLRGTGTVGRPGHSRFSVPFSTFRRTP